MANGSTSPLPPGLSLLLGWVVVAPDGDQRSGSRSRALRRDVLHRKDEREPDVVASGRGRAGERDLRVRLRRGPPLEYRREGAPFSAPPGGLFRGRVETSDGRASRLLTPQKRHLADREGAQRDPEAAERHARARSSRPLVTSGSTRRRTGAVELREAADGATRSWGTLAAKEPPTGRGPERGPGPRLPSGRSHLVVLGGQGARIGVLDEGRHLAEADVRGEGRVRRSRMGLVDVAEAAVCRDNVEDCLGAWRTTRRDDRARRARRGGRPPPRRERRR